MRRTTKSALALAAALAFAPAAQATQLTEQQLDGIEQTFRINSDLIDWAIGKATEALRNESAAPIAPLTAREAFRTLYAKDLIDTPGMYRMSACTRVRIERALQDGILEAATKALQNEHKEVPKDLPANQVLRLLIERGIAIDVLRETGEKNSAPIANACYQDYRAKTPFWPSDLNK